MRFTVDMPTSYEYVKSEVEAEGRPAPVGVKFKKTRPDAITPTRATPGSACVDLYVPNEYTLDPEDAETCDYLQTSFIVDFGIALELPEHYQAQLFIRSSLARDRGITLANGVGIIDADYRGPIKAILHGGALHLKDAVAPGKRIAQLQVVPVWPFELVETEELSDTERGEGGFGSTGG